MIKLYPHQDKAVNHAVSMLYERGNSLIVAGTGAGKTIMMAAAIGKFYKGFVSTNKRKPHILILVHRTEIHGQNHTKFSRVCPEIPTSEITAARKSLHGNAHFGMVQTVAGLLDEFARAGSYFDLIVIDEAHHAAANTYESIIDWNKNGNPKAGLLGVTATPNRGDKLPLAHLFDNFYQITTKFLIDGHYLVRPRFVDLSPTFKIEKGKGEDKIFVDEKGYLSKNCKIDCDGVDLIERLCNNYLKAKENGKSIIFTPSHSFCKVIYGVLVGMGRKPAYLSLGLDDDTRKAELERFEKGDADELINVDICTEGYDYPELRNIVDFDTNGTHGQWVQKVGRVLRTAANKTTCTVMDFGGNVELYPQGVEIDINLEGEYKKPKGECLSESDFFLTDNSEKAEKVTAAYITVIPDEYTPYHPPPGFETINDSNYGIVFVSCSKNCDCIIVGDFEKEDYTVFTGDKSSINQAGGGSFEKCTEIGIAWLGEQLKIEEKPISKLQIQLLAPEYPTTAMTWHGANCAICWKTWKESIIKGV
jgi:superfamily II DNA or RNA helicase